MNKLLDVVEKQEAAGGNQKQHAGQIFLSRISGSLLKSQYFGVLNNLTESMKSVSISDKVGGAAGAKLTHTSEVLTRYFCNFKCQYRRVTGLLAKEIKRRF